MDWPFQVKFQKNPNIYWIATAYYKNVIKIIES